MVLWGIILIVSKNKEQYTWKLGCFNVRCNDWHLHIHYNVDIPVCCFRSSSCSLVTTAVLLLIAHTFLMYLSSAVDSAVWEMAVLITLAIAVLSFWGFQWRWCYCWLLAKRVYNNSVLFIMVKIDFVLFAYYAKQSTYCSFCPFFIMWCSSQLRSTTWTKYTVIIQINFTFSTVFLSYQIIALAYLFFWIKSYAYIFANQWDNTTFGISFIIIEIPLRERG